MEVCCGRRWLDSARAGSIRSMAQLPTNDSDNLLQQGASIDELAQLLKSGHVKTTDMTEDVLRDLFDYYDKQPLSQVVGEIASTVPSFIAHTLSTLPRGIWEGYQGFIGKPFAHAVTGQFEQAGRELGKATSSVASGLSDVGEFMAGAARGAAQGHPWPATFSFRELFGTETPEQRERRFQLWKEREALNEALRDTDVYTDWMTSEEKAGYRNLKELASYIDPSLVVPAAGASVKVASVPSRLARTARALAQSLEKRAPNAAAKLSQVAGRAESMANFLKEATDVQANIKAPAIATAGKMAEKGAEVSKVAAELPTRSVIWTAGKVLGPSTAKALQEAGVLKYGYAGAATSALALAAGLQPVTAGLSAATVFFTLDKIAKIADAFEGLGNAISRAASSPAYKAGLDLATVLLKDPDLPDWLRGFLTSPVGKAARSATSRAEEFAIGTAKGATVGIGIAAISGTPTEKEAAQIAGAGGAIGGLTGATLARQLRAAKTLKALETLGRQNFLTRSIESGLFDVGYPDNARLLANVTEDDIIVAGIVGELWSLSDPRQLPLNVFVVTPDILKKVSDRDVSARGMYVAEARTFEITDSTGTVRQVEVPENSILVVPTEKGKVGYTILHEFAHPLIERALQINPSLAGSVMADILQYSPQTSVDALKFAYMDKLYRHRAEAAKQRTITFQKENKTHAQKLMSMITPLVAFHESYLRAKQSNKPFDPGDNATKAQALKWLNNTGEFERALQRAGLPSWLKGSVEIYYNYLQQLTGYHFGRPFIETRPLLGEKGAPTRTGLVSMKDELLETFQDRARALIEQAESVDPEEAARSVIEGYVRLMDRESEKRYGSSDAWIVSEILAETMASLNRASLISPFLPRGVLSSSLGYIKEMLFPLMARLVGADPELLPVIDAQRTFFPKELVDAIRAPELRSFVRRLATEPFAKLQERLGRDAEQGIPVDEAVKIGLPGFTDVFAPGRAPSIRHPLTGTPYQGHIYFSVSSDARGRMRIKKLAASTVRTHIEAIRKNLKTTLGGIWTGRAYVERPSGSISPTNRRLRLRRLPSGNKEVSGYDIEYLLPAMTHMPVSVREQLKVLNQALQKGELVEIQFLRAGEKASDTGRFLGPLFVSSLYGIPIKFRLTRNYDLLVQVLSESAAARKAKLWASRHSSHPFSLALWNGDLKAFANDIRTYLDNLANDRPGNTNLGDEKRDLINVFLFGSLHTTSTAGKNAKRFSAALSDEDKRGVIREVRADSLVLAKPPNRFPRNAVLAASKKPPVPYFEVYRKALVNFSPDTAAPVPVGKEVSFKGPDGKSYRFRYDGLQDFSVIGKGLVPQFTALEDTPTVVKGSTTYALTLLNQGFELPEELSVPRVPPLLDAVHQEVLTQALEAAEDAVTERAKDSAASPGQIAEAAAHLAAANALADEVALRNLERWPGGFIAFSPDPAAFGGRELPVTKVRAHLNRVASKVDDQSFILLGNNFRPIQSLSHPIHLVRPFGRHAIQVPLDVKLTGSSSEFAYFADRLRAVVGNFTNPYEERGKQQITDQYLAFVAYKTATEEGQRQLVIEPVLVLHSNADIEAARRLLGGIFDAENAVVTVTAGGGPFNKARLPSAIPEATVRIKPGIFLNSLKLLANEQFMARAGALLQRLQVPGLTVDEIAKSAYDLAALFGSMSEEEGIAAAIQTIKDMIIRSPKGDLAEVQPQVSRRNIEFRSPETVTLVADILRTRTSKIIRNILDNPAAADAKTLLKSVHWYRDFFAKFDDEIKPLLNAIEPDTTRHSDLTNLFKVIIAITSPQKTVKENFLSALAAVEQYRRSGYKNVTLLAEVNPFTRDRAHKIVGIIRSRALFLRPVLARVVLDKESIGKAQWYEAIDALTDINREIFRALKREPSKTIEGAYKLQTEKYKEEQSKTKAPPSAYNKAGETSDKLLATYPYILSQTSKGEPFIWPAHHSAATEVKLQRLIQHIQTDLRKQLAARSEAEIDAAINQRGGLGTLLLDYMLNRKVRDIDPSITSPLADAPLALWFGPKVGPFLLNLSGSFSYLTADTWFTRTFYRFLGSPFTRSKNKMTVADAPTLAGERELMLQAMQELTNMLNSPAFAEFRAKANLPHFEVADAQALLWVYEQMDLARVASEYKLPKAMPEEVGDDMIASAVLMNAIIRKIQDRIEQRQQPEAAKRSKPSAAEKQAQSSGAGKKAV